MSNRLKLNWQLSTNTERQAWLTNYLRQEEFVKSPPTDAECEQMADYLLYGKDANTDKNAVQTKDIFIATKHKTWDRPQDESFDALIEQVGFNENSVHSLNDASCRITKSRETFSRADVLAKCRKQNNTYLAQIFQDLFARIDYIDYTLNLYEKLHGTREAIRESLCTKYSQEDTAAAELIVSEWTPYQYLKKKHQLVELRREQYTLRDTLTQSPIKISAEFHPIELPQDVDFDYNINVLPLGLRNNVSEKVFAHKDVLNPSHFNEHDLREVSDYYWQIKNRPATQNIIDFRQEKDVYQLFTKYFELEDAATERNIEANSLALLHTLTYYTEFAELSDIQREILDAKKQGKRNNDISAYINQKYHKNYTPNYISTIFKQKIIPAIANAAKEHEQIVGCLFFEEEFKTCTCCGRTFLRDADHFVRKARSSDGLNSRCKWCDKREREEKKVIKYGTN